MNRCLVSVALGSLLLAGGAACWSVTEPDAPELAFVAGEVPTIDFPIPGPPEVTGGRGGIAVRGGFVTPSGGYVLAATLRRDGPGALTLELRGRQVDPGYTVFIRYDYTALLHGLARGEYRLRVVHSEGAVPESAGTRFDGTVAVR
jgi:hypothetical protein